ncbi:MAG: hypothetical protein LBQ50_12725, partial [Planctomycetaceae bacterium]|nr:hypothetical protein [Planctomycetaceae bacterium]
MTALFRSLWYDRWINAAVILGVFCATAVLTGALLVGDSMRGSLKALTLDRLNRIDTILTAPSFIAPPVFVPNNLWTESVPVIYVPAVVEHEGNVCGVQILGTKHFGNDIVANQTLAERLGVSSGSDILLRINSPQHIPP